MKKLTLSTAVLALSVAGGAYADQPSRGFTIEQGSTAKAGSASVDLGTDGGYTSGGVRLGLDFGEVILNSEKVGTTNGAGYGTRNTEATIKFALPKIAGLAELNHSWAVYGGTSLYNSDDKTEDDYINLLLGMAFTVNVEKLEFTAAPEIIFDDAIDETYFNLGLGMHYAFEPSRYGTFKPGLEVVTTTLSGVDTELLAGVRWEFNQRMNLDIVPFKIGNTDTVSIPGQLRVNVNF